MVVVVIVEIVLLTAGVIAYAKYFNDPDPVMVGAGDIAVCGSKGDSATAKLLGHMPDATIVTLGDNAYEDGTASDFANCYDPSWGRFKARTRPAVGNHEYQTPDASGYFGYFGSAAGDPDKGYYSYDLGDWHVVSLNSMCNQVGGCGSSSPMVSWLKKDLADKPHPLHAGLLPPSPLFLRLRARQQPLYEAGLGRTLRGKRGRGAERPRARLRAVCPAESRAVAPTRKGASGSSSWARAGRRSTRSCLPSPTARCVTPTPTG